ncbi:MAG: AAA family ATPase [Cellulosilyticaceae bacterium]
MKIRKLLIYNYDVIQCVEMYEIPDFVVVAGPNGVGKSTIFKAIKQYERIIKKIYLSDSKGGEEKRRELIDSSLLPFRDTEKQSKIEIEFELSEQEKRFLETEKDTIKGKLDFNDVFNCEFDAELGKLLVTGQKYCQINHINANRYLSSRSNNEVSLSSLSRFYNEDERRSNRISENDTRFEKVKDYLAAIYFDDLIKVVDTGKIGTELKELVDIINIYLKPKEFIGVERDTTGLKFPIKYNSIRHDIDELSSGEKEILMLFVNLKWIQSESYIFLYDEPELHLNAQFEKILSLHLKSLQGNSQIWLSTHSYEILDSVDYKEVFQILHYTGQNQILKLSSKEDKFETFKSLGANVGLQLISEKVIFVEGKTDKDFFELLFEQYKEQLSFVQSTGINNLMKVGNAVLDLLSEASKASDFYLIRDKDFLIAAQIEELREKLNQKIYVLSKYHIENYFLDGQAILEVLRNIGLDVFKNPIEIENKLKEIADKQRSDVIAQWIAYDLHEELRKYDFKVGGRDLEQNLKSRVKSQKEKIIDNLDEDRIVTLLSEKIDYIEQNWEEIWKNLPPGRDILKMFVKEFVDGITYDRFIHLLVRECIKLNTSAIDELKSNLLEELNIRI